MEKTYLRLISCDNRSHYHMTTEGEPPDGWAELPDDLLPIWRQYAPFVTLTVEEDQITGIEDNPEARAAWEALQPPPQMDPILEVKLALAELAEAQAADKIEQQLAIAELAEAMLGGGV